MPNHVKFTAKAGDALLFDHGCWHTAMPNTSDAERRAVNSLLALPAFPAKTGSGQIFC